MNQTVEYEMCSPNQDESIFTGGHGGGSHGKGNNFSTTYKKNRSNRINDNIKIELKNENMNAVFTSFNSSIVPR